jgi:hypothetical protein
LRAAKFPREPEEAELRRNLGRARIALTRNKHVMIVCRQTIIVRSRSVRRQFVDLAIGERELRDGEFAGALQFA